LIEKTLDRDYFLTATEACNFGIVDKVIAKRTEEEALQPK
jgi:ATP-dependent Clp protease protease subunit